MTEREGEAKNHAGDRHTRGGLTGLSTDHHLGRTDWCIYEMEDAILWGARSARWAAETRV